MCRSSMGLPESMHSSMNTTVSSDHGSLVCTKLETCGTARISTRPRFSDNLTRWDKGIQELGLPRVAYEWYLDLRRHGSVKHSGFSLGFEQMVIFATDHNDARDAIPFPRARDGEEF